MSHFHQISLCNKWPVKVISKVLLANRLKPLMAKLTWDCQSSFVPQRQASDKVQELVHTLRRRKGEKTYDRME